MSLPHKSRNVIPVLVALLCLVPIVGAPQTPETTEAARPAAATDYHAAGLKERQEALAKLQEAARVSLSAGETVEAARVLNRVGRLQLILSDPQAALASHNQALDLLKQTPSSQARVDNLNGLAAAYIDSEDPDKKAEPALREALAESERSQYTAGHAEALLVLSDLQNQPNHILALKTAQEALALWQLLDNKAGLARTYDKISQYYLAQNLLPEAIAYSQMALQTWQGLDDKPGQAAALVMLGYIEYRKGGWQDSIDYHTQAQKLIDAQAEPKTMGRADVGLAESFNESGLPEAGLGHLQRAEAYYRQTQNRFYVAYVLRDLGRSYYLLGNYEEAANQLNRSLAEGNDSLLAAQCHQDLGRVYLAKQEYAVALEHLQPALDAYLNAGNPREAAQAQGLIAEVYKQQGRTELARQYFQKALQTFVSLSHHLNQAAILYGLGRLELDTGNYDAAENYLRQSIAVTENVRSISTSRDLTAAFSATVYERYQAYVECLMRKHEAQPDRGFAVNAFESSESARGRSLAELLRATQTNVVPGLEPQLAQQEKSLRQALKVKEDSRMSLLGTQYKQEELETLDADLTRLQADYKKVDETIRARYPAYQQLTQPGKWSLQQVQREVIADDQTLLLEYCLGKEKSYVWAVTREGFKSYELPSQARINQAAEKVYGLLTGAKGTQSENDLAQAAAELGQMVLSPVAADLNKQRIIVVADGALNYIPFQLLPAAGNEPLIANYEIINAPSASILGQLRLETSRRLAPSHLLAAFGDPIFASNYSQGSANTSGTIAARVAPENEHWPSGLRDIDPGRDPFDPATIQPLIYATRELANLRAVAGPETLLVTGFDATRENLARTDLTKYAILHFATHGVLDPKRPENSGLFLSMVDRTGKAQNGFVGLQDIYRLHAPVDLVVLSACRTGLGKDVRGEGLIGLTRGFMYAGASSVMASLWKVDDEATSELMKRFYANMLQKGMTPAAALRAAQNSIRQEKQWRSPRYWAAFTLQGEYRDVIKPTPARSISRSAWLVGLSLLLVLAAGGAWWYRRSTS